MTDLTMFGFFKNINQLCRKWRNKKRPIISALSF